MRTIIHGTRPGGSSSMAQIMAMRRRFSGGSSSGSHGKFGADLRHVLGDETGVAFGQAIGNVVLFHQAQEEGIEFGRRSAVRL